MQYKLKNSSAEYQTKESIFSLECKTSWRILILFSKTAKEITNSSTDYYNKKNLLNELQNFLKYWTLSLTISL